MANESSTDQSSTDRTGTDRTSTGHTADPVEIVNNSAERRYELWLDGSRVGLADYEDRGGAVAILHTEVDPALNGRGLGGRLVKFALDDIRAAGRKVVPSCPFVAVYLQRHPEYADLL